MNKYIKYLALIGNSRFYYFFIILFFINVGLSVFFSVGLLGQLRIFTNTSNSMLPAIDRGSLSLVEKQKEDSYEVGDIVTFYAKVGNKEDIITHRIYRIGGNVYLTKGDRNEAVDTEVLRPRLIIGKVTANIFYLGYWVSFIKSTLGNLLLIIIPALIIIGFELMNIYFLTN